MADSKISALTALTSLSGDETLPIVEDDDGTPVNRKMTIEDFLTAAAARTELTSTYAPRADLAYVEYTSNVTPTATTEATANSVVSAGALSFDGSTRVEIQFFAPTARPALTAGATITFYLYDGSNSIGRFGLIGCEVTSQTAYAPVRLSRFLTPSAASHTYSIRAAVSTGTGLVLGGAGGSGADIPGYIRIRTA